MKLSKKYYYISNDTIYIKYETKNKKFINFNEIEEQFNKIIFLDFTNIEPNITDEFTNFVEIVNMYEELCELDSDSDDTINISNETFNEGIILTDSIVHLILDDDYNLPINLTNNLTHLKFGTKFNYYVILPDSLIYLKLGYEFNQFINLPNSLNVLILSTYYDRDINLPESLKYLLVGSIYSKCIELHNVEHISINSNNLYLIENLPNSLKSLYLGLKFNLPLNNLPNQLKILSISNANYLKRNNLTNLPDSIEHIEFSRHNKYKQTLLNIPKNLRTLKF